MSCSIADVIPKQEKEGCLIILGPIGMSKFVLTRREFKGQMNMGQQDREPLKGKSASERVSKKVSEREGFQRFPEVLEFSEVFQKVFRRPLRDPLRDRFPSQRLSVLFTLVPFRWPPMRSAEQRPGQGEAREVVSQGRVLGVLRLLPAQCILAQEFLSGHCRLGGHKNN